MFENVTYEDILSKMLTKVPVDLDRREGSLIFSALAPAAVEIQNMYIELDNVLKEVFADTASREYLILRCAERGIKPESATFSVVKGAFNINVPIGTRFSCGDLYFEVSEKIEDGIYSLQCETIGSTGDISAGSLLPVNYIDGLTSAEITELLIPGEDEEDTESLRERYLNAARVQSFGGNVADYKETAKLIGGVSSVLVYPAFAGGGTVKLVILDSNYKKPSTTLVNTVQTYFNNLAPIGHTVTVVGADEVTVNITCTITLKSGWVLSDITSYLVETIDDYFLELSKTWENSGGLTVRISQIESRILNISGVLDVTNTKINGNASNLALAATQVPVRGTING